MSIPRNVCIIDFESAGIKPRPHYPPVPCSYGYKEPGQRTKFISWGHPVENTSTFSKAKRKLRELSDKYELVFHNAKFDLEVLLKFFKLKPKHGYHCTQVLAFLHNPYATTFALKPLSDSIFNMPPDEQDNLRDWILDNIDGVSKSKKSPKYWPTYIYLAPAKLVGVYAISDVDRTYKLFRYLWPIVIDEYDMMEPYDRELRLIPYLWGMEKNGVYTKTKQLKKGLEQTETNKAIMEAKIRKRIGVGKNFDLTKKEEFADALEKSGKVDGFIWTTGPKTGKRSRSVSKDNLAKVITDEHLRRMLEVYSKIKTDLQTFLLPWYEVSRANNGFMTTQWNSTRSSGFGRAEVGAKSGRFSSIPNFQNVPREIEVPDHIPRMTEKLYDLIPIMRDFIWPDPGKILIGRDYTGQELRVLAHFEDADLYNEYLKDVHFDPHELARVLMSEMMGYELTRKPVKNISFGILYGMGLALLATKMNIDMKKAKVMYNNYLKIFPGLRNLIKLLKQLEKNNDFLRTWGGRVYYTEPPREIKGRLRHFNYKMLNYLIQPSSADITKEAMIRSIEAGLDLRITLHDELICNAESKTYRDEMQTLRECMESVELDIPLLSDGKWGHKSWSQMQKFKEAA